MRETAVVKGGEENKAYDGCSDSVGRSLVRPGWSCCMPAYSAWTPPAKAAQLANCVYFEAFDGSEPARCATSSVRTCVDVGPGKQEHSANSSRKTPPLIQRNFSTSVCRHYEWSNGRTQADGEDRAMRLLLGTTPAQR